MNLEGLYEFAVILAKKILLLVYEFLHQNFDYIVIKMCDPKIVPLKSGPIPLPSSHAHAEQSSGKKSKKFFYQEIIAVSE